MSISIASMGFIACHPAKLSFALAFQHSTFQILPCRLVREGLVHSMAKAMNGLSLL